MSISKNVDEIPFETRQKLNKELEIKIENKYNLGPPKYVYPFEIVRDNIILPFAYATRQLRIPRRPRSEFSPIKAEFIMTPRPEQEEVLTEALKLLSGKGSVLISCYCGFGKCLKINTPVIMFDGTIKKVQDVVVGDKLMGDDSTHRNVLSLARGQEQMYDIIPNKGDAFGCNESHILSLKVSSCKVVLYDNIRKSYFVRWNDATTIKNKTKYFDTKLEAEEFCANINDKEVVDMSVKDYLNLPEVIQERFELYHVPVEFPEKEVVIDPYFLGLMLGDHPTSFGEDKTVLEYNLQINKHIPYVYKCNSRARRLSLLAGIIDSIGYIHDKMYLIPTETKVLANDIVYVARSLGYTSWKEIYGKAYRVYIYGNNIQDIPVQSEIISGIHDIKTDSSCSDFRVVPIEEKDYYGFTIDGNHRFLLGDFTVTHNTLSSIKLATQIGMKTLVVVNKIVLMKQWEESINRFCRGASVQRLTAKSKDKDCDFYIMNAQNVEKMPLGFFSDIGCVIVDEAHLIMAETLSRSLQHVFPRYLIGLTATPYRPDGLDKLLELYFGKYKIIRRLWREHVAYRVDTGFKPRVEMARNGKVNWGGVLDSQANDEDRNELIIRLLRYFSDYNFLVMVKRVSQGEYLLKRLEELGEDVTSLFGTKQEFETESRILIGTTQKVGTGFDHPRLNALLLAADVEEYFIQYLGRIFRTRDGVPMILDLVDKYSLLEKHFRTRRKVYQDHGGTVKTFDKSKLTE
jgi:superfamily II DNA or RNA helicase